MALALTHTGSHLAGFVLCWFYTTIVLLQLYLL